MRDSQDALMRLMNGPAGSPDALLRVRKRPGGSPDAFLRVRKVVGGSGIACLRLGDGILGRQGPPTAWLALDQPTPCARPRDDLGQHLPSRVRLVGMSPPSPHDHLFKFVFGAPEKAADLARSVLSPEVAAQIDWSRLEPARGTFIDPDLRTGAS